MKSKVISILLVIAVLLTVIGCASSPSTPPALKEARSQLKSSSYAKAFTSALNAIKADPAIKTEGEAFLNEVVTKAEKECYDYIAMFKKEASKSSESQIAFYYQRLNDLWNVLQKSDYAKTIAMKDPSGDSKALNEAYLSKTYQSGLDLLAKGDIESARKAFHEFSAVFMKDENYKEVKAKKAEASEKSKAKLLVICNDSSKEISDALFAYFKVDNEILAYTLFGGVELISGLDVKSEAAVTKAAKDLDFDVLVYTTIQKGAGAVPSSVAGTIKVIPFEPYFQAKEVPIRNFTDKTKPSTIKAFNDYCAREIDMAIRSQLWRD